MSIINDALKKVQSQLDKQEQNTNPPLNAGINKMDNQNQVSNTSSPTPKEEGVPQKDMSEYLPTKEKPFVEQPQIISETIVPAKVGPHWGRVLLTSFIFLLILTAAAYLYVFNIAKPPSLKNYRILPQNLKVSLPVPETIKQVIAVSQLPETKKNDPVVSGIISIGERQAALINNQIYEVGNTLDGKEIINITERTVEIRDSEGTKTLTLQQ